MDPIALITIAAVALAAGAGAGAFAVAGRARRREAGVRDEQAKALGAAMAYFQRSEVNAAAAVNRLADGRLVLLVEAAPLAKFRFSYIIEDSLRKYVFKATGTNIDRVFWRFIIPKKATEPAAEPATAAMAVPAPGTAAPAAPAPVTELPVAKPAKSPAEEILAAKHAGDYEISEESWESYESAQKEFAGTGQPGS